MIYIDRALAMGTRSACYSCQMLTDVIMYIFRRKRYSGVNYIDDFAGVEVGQKAVESFEELCELLEEVGAGESKHKASYAHEAIVFLSTHFNTLTMTMSITPDRMQEILDAVTIWCDKRFATRKQVQHILGKLHFICKCF